MTFGEKVTTMLFATRSADKVRELGPIMRAFGVNVISLQDLGIGEHADEAHIEVFDTFEENALAKARWFYRVSGGMPVLADDSGLEVDALGGRPGVRSKRWSGRHDLSGYALDESNNAYLIAILRGLRDEPVAEERAVGFLFPARYVCAAACVWEGEAYVVRGATEGAILGSPRGAGGFGYDPYFYSHALQQTFGEAAVDDKGAISHRGQAFRKLVQLMMRQRGLPLTGG